MDAPDLQDALAPAFAAALADLGLASTDDILKRADDVISFVPRLWQVADAILAANPGITPP